MALVTIANAQQCCVYKHKAMKMKAKEEGLEGGDSLGRRKVSSGVERG